MDTVGPVLDIWKHLIRCVSMYTIRASWIFLHNTNHACEDGHGNECSMYTCTYICTYCLCVVNLSRLVLFLQVFIQWLSDMYPAYRLHYVLITFIVGEAAGSLLSKRSQSTTRDIAPSWLPSRWGQSVCADTLVDFMYSLDLVLRGYHAYCNLHKPGHLTGVSLESSTHLL